MTLKEYLNQGTDIPQRMPEVILEPKDYVLGSSIKIAGHPTLTPVYVEGVEYTYCLKEGEERLYTTDRDGNPKKLSCFHIKNQ